LKCICHANCDELLIISYICFVQEELKNKEQIFRLIQLNQQQIKSFGVKKIGLFGSYAQQTDDSDIDFIVEFEKDKKSYSSYIKLAFFLEDLFGRKVDLLTNKSLSPYLGPRILNETEYVTLSN
jgi:uncharacterized protein